MSAVYMLLLIEYTNTPAIFTVLYTPTFLPQNVAVIVCDVCCLLYETLIYLPCRQFLF